MYGGLGAVSDIFFRHSSRGGGVVGREQKVSESGQSLRTPAQSLAPGECFLYPNLSLAFDSWLRARHSRKVNCYSYSLDIPRHGWGRPGQLLLPRSKKYDSPMKGISPEDLARWIEGDGLVRVRKSDTNPQSHHVIAAALCPDRDFHFYRWNASGEWSHKIAARKPSRLDASRNTIMSPEECDRGRYEIFVGYFVVPDEGIRYTQDNRLTHVDFSVA